MTPEEFTKSLRNRIRGDLVNYTDIVREKTYQPPAQPQVLPEVLSKSMVRDPAKHLVPAEFRAGLSAAKTNRIALAVFKSTALNKRLRKASAALKDDPQMSALLTRLAFEPATLTDQDQNKILSTILEDDSFLTAPIRAVFSDPDLKTALDIPDDLTFEKYIKDVRKKIADSDNIEDVFAVASVTASPALTAVWFAVALVVAAAAAVVVKTVAALDAWAAVWAVALKVVVFTAAGETAPIAGSTVEVPLEDLRSVVVNGSRRAIWVAVRASTGVKRVAILPGRSSDTMGLGAIEAVLIGGPYNPLEALDIQGVGVRSDGAYVIAQGREHPVRIELCESERGVEVIADEQQRAAETLGRAGWSDLAGGGTATLSYDPHYAMQRCASAAPAGFDHATMLAHAIDAEHFYRTLAMTELLERQWSKPRGS